MSDPYGGVDGTTEPPRAFPSSPVIPIPPKPPVLGRTKLGRSRFRLRPFSFLRPLGRQHFEPRERAS
jgi:hypothetical protein